MLTELTRVDLSSDPDYSYEEMGPSSLSSPLSSDSAFGDQLTCSVELVSLNYLCNGDWALERGGGVNLVKTIDSVLILIFFIIRSPHIEQKIGEAWWRGFFLIMRLTFLDGVLILLFNVITSFFIKMKVRGWGSLLQSICIANLQYLSTEKDLGDKVAFVVFFSYEWRKFTCSWNINKTAYIRINYFLLNVWSAMYRIPNLYLPDKEMNYSSNRGQLVEILIHKNQIPVLPKLYIQIKC